MLVNKIGGGSCSFAVFYSIGWLRIEVGRTPLEIAIGFETGLFDFCGSDWSATIKKEGTLIDRCEAGI